MSATEFETLSPEAKQAQMDLLEETVFAWPRMHKWEENILRGIDETVEQYVFEHYGVDTVGELTEEQVNELQNFVEGGPANGSILSSGFYTLINWWESEQ